MRPFDEPLRVSEMVPKTNSRIDKISLEIRRKRNREEKNVLQDTDTCDAADKWKFSSQ